MAVSSRRNHRYEGASLSILIGAIILAPSSCSHDSYLKVTLQAADGSFAMVTRVVVSVRGGSDMSSAWLQYVPAGGISFDTTTTKTLSISFTPKQSGAISLDVGVLDSSGCLGRGSTTTSIKMGEVSAATVILVHTSVCPTPVDGDTDGGIVDANGDTVTFAGCDPARPEDMCAANQTCFVNCAANRGMCVASGTKGPGEICATNDDCIPGTQCFDYSGLPGCAVTTKICQKFCSTDAQCAPAGGPSGTGGVGGGGGPAGTGGAGPAVGAGACRNPVVCGGNLMTSYRTCSFGCDPRGDAILGCPTGLLCFLYRDPAGGHESPDCGCKEPTRTGVDGASCASSTSCAPGYICNQMGDTQTCRKLCRMTSPTDCTAPKTCNALLNNTIFGVCIGG